MLFTKNGKVYFDCSSSITGRDFLLGRYKLYDLELFMRNNLYFSRGETAFTMSDTNL